MKWVGACVIIAVTFSVGRIIAKEEYEKIKALDSLIKLFSYMKRRISSERAPIFDIFSSFSDEYLECCGFLNILCSHRYGSNTLWNDAVDSLYVNSDIKKELCHFGADLGTLPLNEQLRRIDLILAFIDNERETLRVSLPKKQKSVQSFWLLTGILTAIILF